MNWLPDDHRGLQVLPSTFYPKASRGTLKPSDIMIGLETNFGRTNMLGEELVSIIEKETMSLTLGEVTHHLLTLCRW